LELLTYINRKEQSEIQSACLRLKEKFLNQEPKVGKKALNKAIIMILPHAPGSLVDTVQRAMKADFVQDALMIGIFHSLITSKFLTPLPHDA
jgi:hypothetical protein